MNKHTNKNVSGSIGSEIIYNGNGDVFVQLHPKEITYPLETLVGQSDYKPKKIVFTDVVIISRSIFCTEKDHSVIPCRRTVNILTKEGIEEEYIINAGYCPICNSYTIIVQDYLEIVERGMLLCTVYRYDVTKDRI